MLSVFSTAVLVSVLLDLPWVGAARDGSYRGGCRGFSGFGKSSRIGCLWQPTVASNISWSLWLLSRFRSEHL